MTVHLGFGTGVGVGVGPTVLEGGRVGERVAAGADVGASIGPGDGVGGPVSTGEGDAREGVETGGEVTPDGGDAVARSAPVGPATARSVVGRFSATNQVPSVINAMIATAAGNRGPPILRRLARTGPTLAAGASAATARRGVGVSSFVSADPP